MERVPQQRLRMNMNWSVSVVIDIYSNPPFAIPERLRLLTWIWICENNSLLSLVLLPNFLPLPIIIMIIIIIIIIARSTSKPLSLEMFPFLYYYIYETVQYYLPSNMHYCCTIQFRFQYFSSPYLITIVSLLFLVNWDCWILAERVISFKTLLISPSTVVATTVFSLPFHQSLYILCHIVVNL